MGWPDPSPGKDWRGEKTDRYTGTTCIFHLGLNANINRREMIFHQQN